jgi:hypothetical protein
MKSKTKSKREEPVGIQKKERLQVKSSASKRADGIAIRGKTKGRMV